MRVQVFVVTACAFSLHKNTENYVIVDLVKFTVCQLFFCGTVLLCTSGLPGQRPVTPCVCGALRCSIHPLHCAPRAGHCCPTRAGPVPFLKIAPQSSARGRNWPVPKSYRRQRAKPMPPVRWLCAVSQQHTLSKSAILRSFPNFYTLKVKIFWMFFIRSRLHMNHEMFHSNRSARF